MAICEKLAAESPQDEHLGGTTNNLGALLAATGRYQEAEQAFRKALELQAKVAARSPDRAYYHRQELAGTYHNLGLVLVATGRNQEAEQALRQSIAIREKLVAEVPAEPSNHAVVGGARVYEGPLPNNVPGRHFHHSALANTLHKLAELLRRRGELAEAQQLLEQAIDHQQAAFEFHPTSPNYRRFLLNQYAAVMHALTRSDATAQPDHENSATFPDVWEEYYRAAGSLAGCGSSAETGDDLYALERKALAQAPTARAKKLLIDALKRTRRTPDDPLRMNNLAWLLATHPEPELRDPPRAVELAKKAVDLAPNEGTNWNTLGVAQYRAGDWNDAIEALQKSEELSPDRYFSFNAFFLGLAHWQLDEKDEARKWYDQAVQWMEKNQPQDEDLKRFRAEAEELLGVKEATANNE